MKPTRLGRLGQLASARHDLRDAGDLAKQMTESIADTLAGKILSALDVAPKVTDPARLPGLAEARREGAGG